MSDRLAARRGGVLAGAPSPILVLGAIVSVQSGAALAATLFDRLGPGGTAFLRMAFAAIVLVAVRRPSLRAHTRRELALAGTFGLVLAGMNLSFYEALQRIPLGIAVSLEFAGPLGVALAGSRRRADLAWVALAALGIVALTRPGGHGLDGVGVALALAAGALWAAYILVNARVGRTFAGSTGLALGMCVAAVAVAPVGILDGGGHLLTARWLAQGAAVGVLSSAIPYTFELEALRRIAPPVFGVLMSLEPAVAALAGLVVLGQHLAARAVVGIALVTLACAGASRRGERAPVDV